jgi:MFS family permease
MAFLCAFFGMPSATVRKGHKDLSLSGGAGVVTEKVASTGASASSSVTTWDILKQHWRVLLSVGLFSSCLQLVRSARRLLLTMHGHSEGLTTTQLSNLWAISFFADSVTFPLAGILMDKWGRKSSAVPSMMIIGSSVALLPFASSFVSITMVGVLGGFGNGLSAGLVMVWGADLAPNEHAGQFLGVFRLISDMGFLLGPMVIGVAIDSFSLPFACTATFGVALLSSLFVVFCTKETLDTEAEFCTGTGSLVRPGPVKQSQARNGSPGELELGPVV